MSPFSIFHRATPAELARQMQLSGYRPEIQLRDLAIGIDNLRHDVFLSPRYVELVRNHTSLLVALHGGIQELLAPGDSKQFRWAGPPPNAPSRDAARPAQAARLPANDFAGGAANPPKPADIAAEFKRKTAELQIAGLTLARQQGNPSVDLLLRLALTKFLREALNAQYTSAQEQCRSKLRSLESPGNSTLLLALRETFTRFQLHKRDVLRMCGQDLYETLREIEKETILHMRRSIFGEAESAAYDLFLNRLIFSEDGRDDFIKAEHYVMLGNYERDPDRLPVLRELVRAYFRSVVPAGSTLAEDEIDDLLNVPDNGQELVAGGAPDEGSDKAGSQRALLSAWLTMLEDAGIIDYVLAGYEVVPLLSEYASLINPQQLKNALINRTERERVEALLAVHGKISPANFHASLKRISNLGRPEQTKVAGRFLVDFLRYNRDMRRLEALTGGMDQVNLINTERLRQLSAANFQLYEFLLPEEQKPVDLRVLSHVVIKADVRDSTLLTRTLVERGQNPASYFSLGFYDPVNKLLAKYGASKIFIEGDAIILGIEERDGAPCFPVARASVLAREIISIVRAFHQQSSSLQLPALELGIGIAHQDSAPMYLFDGESRITISDAINRADRLSSCGHRTRNCIQGHKFPFSVFLFQVAPDTAAGGVPDDVLFQYNVGGIQLDPRAFQRLRQEISLQEFDLPFADIWGERPVLLYSGLVPVTTDLFQPLVIRQAAVPLIDARDFSLRSWTEHLYYEVCTSDEVYQLVEQARQRAATV
jgi:hypothetical protein